MRILTFLHSFEPGGVERIALRMVRAWRAEGVDAPLFMGRSSGAMRADVAGGLAYCEPRQPPVDTRRFETLWMIARLPRAIRDLRPDALFCAGNSYAVVAVAMKLLLGRRCPPIVAKISNDLDRRDMPWIGRPLYRLWLRIQGRTIDHFVGLEEPMAAEIAQAIRPARGAVSIIPDPALSDELIARLRSRHGERRPAGSGRRFVAIGRLVPQKNVELMVRAFARGAQPADRLTIVGEGPRRARIEALVRRLGLTGKVLLPGHLPEPAGTLPHHDVFLLSSDYEGVPAVILEALAAGLPVVATRCSRSMAALLDEGRLGDLIPVGDVDAFAAALARARPDAQDALRSLDQARRFTMERSAHAYLACFRSLPREAGEQLDKPRRESSWTRLRWRNRHAVSARQGFMARTGNGE